MNNISGSFAEKILCLVSEPAIVFDKELKVVWVNPSAEMLFGHSSEFLFGKKCTELFIYKIECLDTCPVKKSMITGKDEILTVDGILSSQKLIEAVPFNSGQTKLTLAVIHSLPEMNRNEVLKRNFTAKKSLK